MESREDRRVSMTRKMLKDALTDMLRETDIYHVSIRELCRRADVNRSTFYKHYGSQFDLLADMEKDLLDFLARTITEHAANPERIIETACRYLEDHLEFGRLILNNNMDPLFPQKLFSMTALRELAAENSAEMHDEAMMEYSFNFVTYGAFRILYIWLNKDQRESPEQIARLLMQMIRPE